MDKNPIQLSSSMASYSSGWFPNLAGVETCDETMRKELEEAGIVIDVLPRILGNCGEVPYRVIGSIPTGGVGYWSFIRAWRYWVVEGPGLALEDATELHESHGTSVRVNGHCGCPSPKEQNGNFATGDYHVDTQEGLNALATMIRKVAERGPHQVNWTPSF